MIRGMLPTYGISVLDITMSWESCVVLLNSDSTGRFFTGDIVTGTVVLELKEKQRINHVDFKVVGVCKATWSRSMPTVPFIRVYSEKQKVLELDIDVFKDLEGQVVEPGIKTFQFHFHLPPCLPSSFESAIAKAHYFIKIDGKASCKFVKHKIVPFAVQGKVNVNHMEEYLAPAFTEFENKLWRAGVIKISFKTFRAYAPKQQAPFEIIITNEKNAKISKIRVTLVQKIKYIVKTGYADEEFKLCKVGHKKFANTVIETCIFSMEIPQTIPSSVHLEDPMINVSYVFRVEVFFAFHNTIFKDIPVLLTTIPVLHYDFNNCL